MKRKFSLFLVLTMLVLTLASISVSAAVLPTYVLPLANIDQTTLTSSGLIKCNTATLSVSSSTYSSLTIPASYDISGTTYNVTGIADLGFNAKGSIKVPIIIPEGVTSIGAQAFKGCTAVKGFVIPSTVTTIGDAAFQQTSAVLSFTNSSPQFEVVGNSLYSADGKNLVAYAGGITDNTFVVPEGVENICAGAIRGANNLVTIEYPSTLKTIGTSGTYGCTNMTYVKFNSLAAPTIAAVNFNDSAAQASKRAFTVYYPETGTGYADAAFTKYFVGNSTDISAPATYITFSTGEPTCPISSVTQTATGYDVSFTVPTVADENPYIVLALYDSQNHLVGVKEGILKTDTTASIDVSGVLRNAVTAKLMVWNNKNEIKPLTDIIPFTIS